MDIAKITSKGQITIPIEIRKLLGLKEGDKVLFVQDGDHKVTMMNASMQAILELQETFKGAAEEAGIRNEDDVVALVKEVRKERSEEYTCE